ncbi:Planctomycete cytochrome C [Bremerella volcania]|uniref:Planctomycete cytochrome C n=1 Tax=Bremerella volcania TaxID=2527984 RepID=A0A518CC23_9BACT|nr:c-type cytochrome domain-containing protein [Bremerella volcania]QDU76773.1 Planctomycete cytochrome C [Bremerella volcania]
MFTIQRFVPVQPCVTLLSTGLAYVLILCGSTISLAAESPDEARLAAKVKEVFRSRCLECHGGSAVQGGVEVMKVAELREMEYAMPGEPDDSLLYQVLTEEDEDARMPLGQPALDADEIALVRKWISAGAKDFPADVASPSDQVKENEKYRDPDYLLEQILKHQRSLPLEDRFFIRYFSSHHLLVGGATRDELQRQRDALFKALNHLSYQKQLVRPEVVNDDIETLFAVDLRKLNWHRTVAKSEDDAEEPRSLDNHDLLILEYPYAVIYEASQTYDSLAQEYLRPSKMIRPVPYVRIDWFCSTATLPPLYHDLLQLPLTLEELEKNLDVDSQDNIDQRIAKRAGMAVSGVSRNNRAVERHPYEHGAYWKSIDYISSKGTDNIFIDPIHLVGTGGEMIFNLPNGMQAYYVADGAGGRLDFAPTSIVTDRLAEDKTVRNGLSCIRCHDRGMKAFQDDVRPAVELISGSGHIDKRSALELYPKHEVMDELVKADQERFLNSVEKLLGHPQDDEPLTPVTKRFLEAPLQLHTVAGELGLSSTDELRVIVRQPRLTGLGLVSLADAGVIRRDMWEDFYDQVITGMGIGIPVISMDGVTRPDYIPSTSTVDVRVSTSRRNNIFSPGDELAIFVENKGSQPVFIEMIGRSFSGKLASILPAGTKLAAGEKRRFPEDGTLKVKPALGREEIIVYAGEKEFPSATIVRGDNVTDRIVHPFYQHEGDGRPKFQHDPRGLIKRTLTIETR